MNTTIYTLFCILFSSSYVQLHASENSLSTTPSEDLSLSFIFSGSLTDEDKEKAERRLEQGASPNIRRYSGPLLHSVIRKSNDHDTSLVFSQMLCKHNADVNVKDNDKETPLMLATKQKNEPLVKFFLEQGALPNERDRNEECPIHVAMEWDTEKETFSYKKRSFAPNIVLLLLRHGADPNARYPYKGATPLHAAVFHNAPTIVQALLYYGAKKNATDDRGYTPLTLAQLYKHQNIIDILSCGIPSGYTPPSLSVEEEIESFHLIDTIKKTPFKINTTEPFLFNNIILIDDYQSTSTTDRI